MFRSHTISRRILFIFMAIIAISTLSQRWGPIAKHGLAFFASENVTEDVKIILIWTLCYGKDNGLYLGFGRDKFSTCPVSNCETTKNRSLFNQSDAVVFLVLPGDFDFDDLPTHRLPNQRFVMYNFEPPLQTSREQFDDIDPHYFNWTFTYRRTADIVGNSYGDYTFKKASLDRRVEGDYDQEESLQNYYGINITGKSKMAAWFTSHCHTASQRENFYLELRKYIQIDVYGGCSKLKCSKTSRHEGEQCNEMLANDYFFYLAFENSFCPDYVTEKFFRALRSGVVPVVLGAAHYSRFAPPHSYVNALDFASPKELADHLTYLSANPKLYSHFFEWRRHFEMKGLPIIDGWCRLCAMLNDATLPPKSYANMSQWWFNENPCQEKPWKLASNTTRSL